MRSRPHTFVFAARVLATVCLATAHLYAASAAWVETSNKIALRLLAIEAQFAPENRGPFLAVVPEADDKVRDLKPGLLDRQQKAFRGAIRELQERLDREKDPRVRVDVEIMLAATRHDLKASELDQKYQVPYYFAPRIVFNGIRALLDDQMPTERRQKALVRLRRYAGLEPGFQPIARLAEQRTREGLGTAGLLAPSREQINRDLSNAPTLIEGIGQLFERFRIDGYQVTYDRLKEQLTAYDDFLKRDVLPRGREDFRLPPELYAFGLENRGIDIPAEQLTQMAHEAFRNLQREIEPIASAVAKSRGYATTGYREVIRNLKKEQLIGDAILPHYQQRLAQIEEIVRREHLVTLPARPALIRLGTPAENAANPAPHMVPPSFLANHGQKGVFVLPLALPSTKLTYDDFTFAAASWTVVAHEARPGHELQFDGMVENGISIARGLLAFNGTNAEGWGLYCEALMRPFMSLEGRLVSLDYTLLRAARAFLDPELHRGLITPTEARRVLAEDFVASDAFVTEEVERYMFEMPAQAPTYFYGYTRLLELRSDVEQAMGTRFEQQKFHDFVLAEGLLPPAQLRKAVFDGLVKE